MAGTNTSEHSEYDGGGIMPNTVYPKGPEALTPSDKLRLDSITGQHEDSRAKPDPWHWVGGKYHPDELAGVEEDRLDRVRRGQEMRREATERYEETPY